MISVLFVTEETPCVYTHNGGCVWEVALPVLELLLVELDESDEVGDVEELGEVEVRKLLVLHNYG